MQGATTDDEPMGRNPGTSEAANLTALKVRGCHLAPRFADLIEASGHVPCFKAVHMNAPSTRVKSLEKLLAAGRSTYEVLASACYITNQVAHFVPRTVLQSSQMRTSSGARMIVS